MNSGYRWTGRTLSGIAVLFLAFDAAIKVLGLSFAIQATVQLGYPERLVVPIGIIEIVCLVLYLLPRTAVLGAVLWTGYLGGALASHLRLGDPLFADILFPVYVAALLWGGLWLRDARVGAIVGSGRGAASAPPAVKSA